jgi:hypothetical protein
MTAGEALTTRESGKEEKMLLLVIRRLILDALATCDIEYGKINIDLSRELNERIAEIINEAKDVLRLVDVRVANNRSYSITRTNPAELYQAVSDIVVPNLSLMGLRFNGGRMLDLVTNLKITINKIIDHERANRLAELEHNRET